MSLFDKMVKIEEPIEEQDDNEWQYELEEIAEKLSTLVEQEYEVNYEVRFDGLIYKISVRGIPEDCRIYVQDTLVCEYVYGNVYNTNTKAAGVLLNLNKRCNK